VAYLFVEPIVYLMLIKQKALRVPNCRLKKIFNTSVSRLNLNLRLFLVK